jgi:alpha-1,2-mannosyltransferase
MYFEAVCLGFLTFLYYIWPLNYKSQLFRLGINENAQVLVIFHPFCDNGGGGERVLWMGIQALQKRFPAMIIAIYTWSGANFEGIPSKVKSQFGVELNDSKIVFLPLKTWKYLEANRYPRLTLILSSLGSLITGWEALCLLRPTIFVETVGFAFLYPLFKLFGAQIIAYVHYPTISSDMLIAVKSRKAAFNNNSIVASSSILSFLKLQYYLLFSVCYRFVGSYCDVVMANSSWTAGHINEIWEIPNKTSIVFPPCDVSKLIGFDLKNRNRLILSVAQFRPEKDHHLQIEILADLFKKYPEYRNGPESVKLIFLGSVRNDQDEKRVADIQAHIDRLGLKVLLR